MACNFGPDKKSGKGGGKGDGLSPEDGESGRQLLSAASTATSKQNGDHAKCEDGQTCEQEAPERRRAGPPEHKPPAAGAKAADELPRRSFQIPRKIKERKGLLQHLYADSREFEEVMKLLSTSYLDPNSRGTFTYTKASLVHNELLEKEFIEKKRELKQNGRTEAELLESFAFLLPDKNKVHWICEKGLSVGHSRVSNLGTPVKGVYLSKYSDLLQMNPFEVGATGEIIIFKVMKGRVKTIFENVPKSNLEPVPKFDSHVYKNASKVTSLLSYRAFEHTQQYFYEFAFDELRPRPRHVLPYAVLSFQFKGKESVTAAHSRLNSIVYEGPRVRRRYTLWSGSLVNKGQEVCQVSIRASNLPILPLKIPEKLDVDMAMHIEQVRKKIPGVLSWETYSGSQEVLKCGMFCSLYELIGKNKPENSVSGILQRLEEERMVLVKPLPDKGFLFIISSSQLHKANEKRGRHERGLMALFIFQEPRICSRTMLRRPGADRDGMASPEPKDPVLEHLYQLTPALHHGLCKLRLNPPKELAGGVKRHALDYLRSQQERGPLQTFFVPEYRHSLDNKTALHTTPRPKNMDAAINSYFYSPGQFQLPGEALLQGVVDSRPDPGSTPPPPPAEVDESSPVSDWGGSGSGSIGVSQPNGGVARSQGQYNKEKMEKLLKLIQMHKRTLGKDDVGTREDELDALTLKRKLEREGASSVSKYLKTSLFNGAPGRVGMGLCDTDLREHVAQNSTVGTANNLLKIIFNTLMAQKSGRLSESLDTNPSLDSYDLAPPYDLDLRNRQTEDDLLNDFSEDQTPRSSVDVYSPSSGVDQPPSRLSEASHQTNHSWKMFLADDFVDACVSEAEKQEPSSDPVDFILDKELSNLGVAIQQLMDGQRIVYTPQPTWPRKDERDIGLHKTFSHFISKHITPLPLQGYVNTFCERMNQVMAPLGLSSPPPVAPLLPSPPALKPSPVARPQASLAKPHVKISKPPPSAKVKDEASAGRTADPKGPDALPSPALCSPSTGSASHTSTPSVPDIPPEPSLSALSSSVSDVIGQIQPDVLCTLMEIVQKNAVRFYIQKGDEESQLCTEIRAYLKSLGNVECNPQNYLEIRSQQKFMIIIQNEDIAPHVHKIPALVRLKKLPTVYFAGVDSLDDVKNRTYNELFVSGGLIVSDEMILNPDCMTLGKLQSFLQFLEDQGSLWKWKVHCKTQKKLKELSRLNTEALDLLNLLTAYQKKHLVEFLPYHECDTPSRQAPGLDCLVKLQAQHTQLRHIVFLTEKHDYAVSQFSGCGVIVSGMSDIINDFQCLISHPGEDEVALPPPGTTPQPGTSGLFRTLLDSSSSVSCPMELDAVVDEEDMSLDSDDDSTAITDAPIQTEAEPLTDAFQPPRPEPHTVDPGTHLNPSAFSSQASYPIDYAALETALTQFKPACPEGAARTETDDTLSSFGVNPHQSYLCPTSAQWSPFPASLAFAMPTAYSSAGGVADYTSLTNCPNLPTGVTPPSHLPQAPPTPDPGSSQQTPAPAQPESAAKPMTPTGAQDEQSGAEAAYPSYPEAGGFPPLTPIPPVPALFNWGQMAGSQHRGGFSKPEPSDGAWTGASENGGSQVQEDSSAHLHKDDMGGTAEGLTSSAQGSRTPVDSSSDCSARASRGLLPVPGAPVGPLCRGGHNSNMYNPRGLFTPPDMMRGGFRGRGMPQFPMRSRPGRGQVRGGPSCNWGYPPGRGGGGWSDYHPDYTYN